MVASSVPAEVVIAAPTVTVNQTCTLENGIYKGSRVSQGGWAIDMVYPPQLNPDTRKLNLLAEVAILTDNSSILRVGFHVTSNGTLVP